MQKKTIADRETAAVSNWSSIQIVDGKLV